MEEKIIETIKKVLNLSKNNPNEAEAKAAALKAQELLAKYHISIADVESFDETMERIGEMSIHVGTGNKWKRNLASIVARNFRCKCYIHGSDEIVMFGYETDVRVARDVYQYLFTLGNKLANKEYVRILEETGSGAGVKNEFLAGYLAGLRESLDAQCTALMIITPKAVEDKYAEHSKSFRSSNSRLTYSRNHGVYNTGYTEGKYTMGARQIRG